jgi:hypothetical protein
MVAPRSIDSGRAFSDPNDGLDKRRKALTNNEKGPPRRRTMSFVFNQVGATGRLLIFLSPESQSWEAELRRSMVEHS